MICKGKERVEEKGGKMRISELGDSWQAVYRW